MIVLRTYSGADSMPLDTELAIQDSHHLKVVPAATLNKDSSQRLTITLMPEDAELFRRLRNDNPKQKTWRLHGRSNKVIVLYPMDTTSWQSEIGELELRRLGAIASLTNEINQQGIDCTRDTIYAATHLLQDIFGVDLGLKFKAADRDKQPQCNELPYLLFKLSTFEMIGIEQSNNKNLYRGWAYFTEDDRKRWIERGYDTHLKDPLSDIAKVVKICSGKSVEELRNLSLALDYRMRGLSPEDVTDCALRMVLDNTDQRRFPEMRSAVLEVDYFLKVNKDPQSETRLVEIAGDDVAKLLAFTKEQGSSEPLLDIAYKIQVAWKHGSPVESILG